MKKHLLTSIVIVVAGLRVGAQDVQSAAAAAAAAISRTSQTEKPAEEAPKYWNLSSDFDLGFNQTGLINWAAGGYSTITLSLGLDAKANYGKDMMSWNNRLQLNYGFLWSKDKANLLQKSNDRIYFESKWGYKTSKESKWNYTASFSFRSQFTDSYEKYVQDPETQRWHGTLKSGFLSPAYTDLALGMEWRPNDWFSLNFAPVTGGFTICTEETLRKSYGMHLRDDSLDPAEGSSYRSFLFQFGAQIKADVNISINDNLNYNTQLILFTDYLDKPFGHNRVNWDNKISWNAAKFFKIAFNTWMIYDPIVEFDGVASKVQFKEFFAISFNYTLTGKNKK